VAAGVCRLALPPKGVTRGFYFHKNQWLADARTLAASAQFLWECWSARADAGGDSGPASGLLTLADGAREAGAAINGPKAKAG